MLIAIVSDTHLPRGERAIPARCVELMGSADLIVHAGDFVAPDVLDRIERLGPPVTGVHGNMDAAELRHRLPAQATVDVAGASIAVVHDAGPASGRLARLRRRFPAVDAVVFGHSHMPLLEQGDGFQIVNPGSPTERRRAPSHTMALGHAENGMLKFEIVTLP